MFIVLSDMVMPTPMVIPVYMPVEVNVAIGLVAVGPEQFVMFCKDVIKLTSGFEKKPPQVEEG